MTIEEAIKMLRSKMDGSVDTSYEWCECIRMAIKALEQEPCEDCISREQALKELKESAENHAIDSREDVLLRRDRDIIRALPSVTPEQKTDVLDKIRADIAMYEADCRLQGDTDECEKCNSNVFGSIFRIIDKYKESEE